MRELRAQATALTNAALVREGIAARVDHRSYAEQDQHLPPELQRLPTAHLGPLRTTLERSGVATARGDLNRTAAAHTVELRDPVERHRLLTAAVTYNGHVRGNAQWELQRLPEAPTAQGIAWAQQRLLGTFGHVYQKPEKARVAFERAPEGERLQILRARPEAFGKLREVETHRTWGGLVSHYDTSGARSHATEAVTQWQRWVLEPTAKAAAAVPKREALTREIVEADQWGAVLGAEVQRLDRAPEVVRARQREQAEKAARAQVLAQAREDARQFGRDYAQERAHLRLEQLAKEGPAAPLLEPQREAHRTALDNLQREITREISRAITPDRGLSL